MTSGIALSTDSDSDSDALLQGDNLGLEEYDERSFTRQLYGWLSYAFASEAFVIVSATLFLPICLEQFARDNGFLEPDRIQPCVASSSTAGEMAIEQARCVVKLGWAWIDSASFSLYVNSASVALQALTVISMGGIADRPSHRKRLLLSFAAFGSCAATLFLVLPSTSPVWPLIALLGMCAYVCFGASVVALNAYLPVLARSSKDVIIARQALLRVSHSHNPDSDGVPEDGCADAPLLAHATSHDTTAAQAKYDAALSSITTRLSAQGIAYGCSAGIMLLLFALIPVRMLGGSTASLRLAIGLSGIWWGLFTLPAAAWLPGGAALKEEEGVVIEETKERGTWREIGRAWMRLGGMLRWSEIRRLRNTFKFLAAWFLLSDAFTTISNTAILFAKTSLHMSTSALVIVGALAPTAAIAGSLLWTRFQRALGWTTLRTLITLVLLASFVPIYGCLGFLPIFKTIPGGFTTPAEMYIFAVIYGFIYGAFSSYTRAMYSEFIPPGEEARWFALFSITDKSSSFFGPLIVGIISDLTGNIRYSFVFLSVMTLLAVPILMCIDGERGREDARKYSYRSQR